MNTSSKYTTTYTSRDWGIPNSALNFQIGKSGATRRGNFSLVGSQTLACIMIRCTSRSCHNRNSRNAEGINNVWQLGYKGHISSKWKHWRSIVLSNSVHVVELNKMDEFANLHPSVIRTKSQNICQLSDMKQFTYLQGLKHICDIGCQFLSGVTCWSETYNSKPQTTNHKPPNLHLAFVQIYWRCQY